MRSCLDLPPKILPRLTNIELPLGSRAVVPCVPRSTFPLFPNFLELSLRIVRMWKPFDDIWRWEKYQVRAVVMERILQSRDVCF